MSRWLVIGTRYWRHFPLWAWAFMLTERCRSCGRWRGRHNPDCYWAPGGQGEVAAKSLKREVSRRFFFGEPS